MADGQTALRGNPVDWLLEEDNPSVRYRTMVDLLEMPETDAAVQAAREAIMRVGAVPMILRMQGEKAYREAYPHFYTAKYKGLVWSLILLGEFGAARTPQIEEQCEYLFAQSQEPDQGGFSQHTAARADGGRLTEVIPCLTGNLVWALIQFGYLNDPRLQKGIRWLTQQMRYNDGELLHPQSEHYAHYEACWGAHTCHMGVVKALKAFSAIPPEARTPEVNAAIAEAAEFMLIHHVYKRSHNLARTSKPGWKAFGFPLMYQTDALEVLDCLTALGFRDERMQEAIDLTLQKQDDRGRWMLENAYAAERTLVMPEQAGKPSKWITLRALRVLKRYGDGVAATVKAGGAFAPVESL